jgi:hypothetical protein
MNLHIFQILNMARHSSNQIDQRVHPTRQIMELETWVREDQEVQVPKAVVPLEDQVQLRVDNSVPVLLADLSSRTVRKTTQQALGLVATVGRQHRM